MEIRMVMEMGMGMGMEMEMGITDPEMCLSLFFLSFLFVYL